MFAYSFYVPAVVLATFVNSCFHADDMAALLVLAGKYADIETGAHILSAALLLSGVLVNVWVYVAIRKIKPSNFDWWVSAFFLAFILFCIVVSVTGSIVTGKPVTELFFERHILNMTILKSYGNDLSEFQALQRHEGDRRPPVEQRVGDMLD